MRKAMFAAMVFLLALSLAVTAISGGELPEGVEVVQCLWPQTVPLGAPALYHALVINGSGRRLLVVAPRVQQDSQKARFFVSRGAPCQYQVMKALGIPFVPSRELVALGPSQIALEPGEMGVWDVPLPVPGGGESSAPGTHRVVVDLALGYPMVSTTTTTQATGSTSPPKGAIVIQNIGSNDPTKWRIPNAYHHQFTGTYTLTEPSGNDKVYFERYIKAWFRSHDCDDYVQSVFRKKEARRTLSQDTGKADPSSLPFSEIKQRQSFKELEDNRYAALAGYGGGRKITLLDTVRRYALITPGPGKYHYGPHVFQSAISSFDRAEYFVREYNLGWQAYLSRAVFFIGTAKEERALKAIREVATSSPDCVARYLAKRVLEVYDEVRGGKNR